MNDDIPLGSYAYEVPCWKCGRPLQLYTEANMSDPEVAEIVRRMAKMTQCDLCRREARPARLLPPWEFGTMR